MSKAPLVFVVDDDPAVRDSLRVLLESVDLDVRPYANAEAFLAGFEADALGPAALLLDVRMPGTSGMALLEHLRVEHPALPIILITGHGDIDMAVRAMKLGAKDFITKPFSAQRLLDRIQEVLRQSAGAAAASIDAKEAAARLEVLTLREREVFDRIVAGESNKAIAIELGISVRTVESHRASVMEKLGVKTLVDLVLLAVRLDGRSPK
jgi:two-component system response regulator FixJ